MSALVIVATKQVMSNIKNYSYFFDQNQKNSSNLP